MSNKPPKPSGERSSPLQNPASTAAARHTTEPEATRKRANSKRGIQLPAIHLSLKTSTSALSSPRSRGGLSIDHDVQRTGFRRPQTSPVASSSPSITSPGRSAGRSPSSHGTNKSVSPMTASPDRLSLLHNPVSSSLPVTLSALSSEPSLELAQPSPSSVSSVRRLPTHDKSLSPYAHGSPQSLTKSRSNTNLRVASRLPSDPVSRTATVASVERDAGVHLDMKRLLSKPAHTGHSGSSIISATSDSEAPKSPRPRQSISRQPSSQRIAVGPAPKDRATARRATDEGTSEPTLRKSPSRGSVHTAAAQPQKPRNVLRRKSSTHTNPATPTAQTFHTTSANSSQSGSGSSSKTSKPRAPEPSRSNTPRRAASATAAPVSLTSLRRAKSPPSDLTPAGAVAHAYKQQEQRREELAEVSGWNEQMGQAKSRGGQRAVSADSRAVEEDGEEGSGAYYTVFGGSAGRVVAVGSAEDSDWDLGYDSRFSQEGRVHGPSRGHVSGVRSLGRKVSGRFKKSGPGSVIREPSPYAGIVEPYDGRQEVSATHSGRTLGASMDEYVDVRSLISSGMPTPTMHNGMLDRKDGQRGLRPMKSFVNKEPEPEKRNEDSSPGGKLWKLVKRISTGALRDKYHDPTPPPPVPALPADIKHMVASRTTFDIRPGRDTSSETGVSRFMYSRTSMSGVRPSTAPQRGTPRTERPGSRPSTGPRPSTTTRSSSPVSSDMASSRFFHKSHSTHSSMSSYGEELPPLPHVVGQPILSAGELVKLGTDTSESVPKKDPRRSRSRTRSLGGDIAHTPNDIRPSLPPPRRSHTAGSKPTTEHESDPPSPLIPTFETSEPTNNFTTPSASRYSLPTSEFGVVSEGAPPRPKRSSRRKPPPFDIISPTASTPTSPLPVTPRTPRSPNRPSINVDVRNLDRKSLAGSLHSSTIHEHSASPSSATTSHFRSPLRFREIDSPRTHLSEREKAAKWDDLLMRSEQAGGTLHLGESGLMSDTIRFSDNSGSEA